MTLALSTINQSAGVACRLQWGLMNSPKSVSEVAHFRRSNFGDENESMTLVVSRMWRGVTMAHRLSQNLQRRREKGYGNAEITAKTTEE
jgi:hypothetical protein